MAARKKDENDARVFLLWGPEELRKREALETLLAQRVSPENRDLDLEFIDAGNPGLTAETILHAVRDRAMFSDQRVVVVRNAGRLRGPRHQRTQEVLAEGIKSLPDYSTLVFVAYAEDGERRNRAPFGEKLMAALRSHGVVRQFAQLKPEELAQLAIQEAAAGGKKLPQPAAMQLAQRVGPDSQRLLQEVRKLIVYVGDRSGISAQDVADMVAAPPDDNIFHMLDAIMRGQQQHALTILQQLRDGGTSVHQVIPMLARTIRQVAQAKYLQEARVQPRAESSDVLPDVLDRLPEDGGLYSNSAAWQRDRLWEQARRISWPHLQRALDRLAVLDAGGKGWEHGIEDPDLAMELYIASLCSVVRAPAPSAGSGGGNFRRAGSAPAGGRGGRR